MKSVNILKLQESSSVGMPSNLDFQSRLDLTCFLKFYFDTAYILCLSPFRFSLTKPANSIENAYFFSDRRFIARSWWLQNIFCILLAILGSLWLLQEVRGAVPKNTQNPSQYFDMVLNMTDLTLKIVTLKKFWRNRTDFLNVANFILGSGGIDDQEEWSGSNILAVQKRWRCFGKVVALLVISFYCGMGLLNWGVGTGVLATFGGGNASWSLEWWWARMVTKGYQNLFLEIPSAQNGSTDIGKYSSAEILIGILSASGFFQRYVAVLKSRNSFLNTFLFHVIPF